MGSARIGDVVGRRRVGLGAFEYEVVERPPAFVVRVRGVDGPVLLKDALAVAEAFGEEHPGGWVWITDLRRLVWTSPRSFFYVRRIRQLPGNRGYAVIARLPFRLLGNAFGRAFGAERFVATPEEALAFAATRSA